MTDLENWENGTDLSYAMISLTDQHQVAKYRKASTWGATLAYKQLMLADLFAQLEAGELLAFGFKIHPTISEVPIRIPHHVFETEPDIDESGQCRVSASGVQYERVKVLSARVIDVAEIEPVSPRKVGRQDTYRFSKPVLEVLHTIDSNKSKSAAKLLPDFRTEFEKQFPIGEFKIAPPEERNASQAARKISATIAKNGNNDFFQLNP